MNRKELNMLEERPDRKKKNKLPRKYVRYSEGAEMYGIGLTKFQELAKEAKAVVKIDGIALVKIEDMDNFIESFKL